MQLTEKQIDYCMECGVCTGSCPVNKVLPTFSPRQMIKKALRDPAGEPYLDPGLWACLGCSRCSTRCPVEIDFPEFVRFLRQKARDAGNLPQESHHGIMQCVAELQLNGRTQNRTAWAEGVGDFGESGDVFYFVGCLPYFEVVFQYLELSPLESARSVLKLLNRMGITPVISNEERCCGHDALVSGNEETFRKLAERNLEVIKSSGAKTVLFSCPEGYTTFKNQYPKHLGSLPFEVLHMTEFLARELPTSGLEFTPSSNGAVTFHDPCRLGRGAGIYEAPRDLLKSVPDVTLVEMGRNRANALCCGTSAWMECASCSKAMRLERLQEALDTGSGTMVTACPKCQIHFTCAQRTAGMDLNITDIYAYLSEHLSGE